MLLGHCMQLNLMKDVETDFDILILFSFENVWAKKRNRYIATIKKMNQIIVYEFYTMSWSLLDTTDPLNKSMGYSITVHKVVMIAGPSTMGCIQ